MWDGASSFMHKKLKISPKTLLWIYRKWTRQCLVRRDLCSNTSSKRNRFDEPLASKLDLPAILWCYFENRITSWWTIHVKYEFGTSKDKCRLELEPNKRGRLVILGIHWQKYWLWKDVGICKWSISKLLGLKWSLRFIWNMI